MVHAEPLATVRWYKVISSVFKQINIEHHHKHPCSVHDHPNHQETMVLDGSDRRRMEEFGKKHLLLLGSMDRHGQSHDDDDDDDDDDEDEGDDDDDDLDGRENSFGD